MEMGWLVGATICYDSSYRELIFPWKDGIPILRADLHSLSNGAMHYSNEHERLHQHAI